MSITQINKLLKKQLDKTFGNTIIVLGSYQNCRAKILVRSNKTGRVWKESPERLLGQLNA